MHTVLLARAGSRKVGDLQRPPGQREQRTRRAGAARPGGDWRLAGSPGRAMIGRGLAARAVPPLAAETRAPSHGPRPGRATAICTLVGLLPAPPSPATCALRSPKPSSGLLYAGSPGFMQGASATASGGGPTGKRGPGYPRGRGIGAQKTALGDSGWTRRGVRELRILKEDRPGLDG
jgi:hypothetical protein